MTNGWNRVLGGVALAASAALAAGGPATAADMKFVSMVYSADRFVPQFHYDGPVVKGDDDAFNALVDKYVECTPEDLPADGGNCAVVTLNSPGGNYREGLDLAQTMRDRAIATVVEADMTCYSACAFAFLGGSGYSSQAGVGAYIDRMIEPGAILGFHAPYFASDSLDGLVAQYGLDTVLGASRDDISLMIRNLVDWNVDPNVLSHVVSMGPEKTYDVTNGEDMYLMRTHLPPAPLPLWVDDKTEAVRNACILLVANHEDKLPSAVMDRVPGPLVAGIGTTEFGVELSGFRLGPDNPLGVTWCAIPTSQTGLDGDIDMGLYTAPGIQGHLNSMLSFFDRPHGWSNIGTGGTMTRSIRKKDGMNHVFQATVQPVQVTNTALGDYLAGRKFAVAGHAPDAGVVMPSTTMDLASVPGGGSNTRVLQYSGTNVIVQAGSDLLYETALAELPQMAVDITHSSTSATGFVFGGTYPSGRPFLWFGMNPDGDLSSVVRIEASEVPGDTKAAVSEQYRIACSISYEGVSLKCN